jgi:two-component system response regulator NreC
VRVIVADDHRLLREGLKSLLQRNGFEVIAEADDGRTAVKLAKKFRPRALIMDISMPELNGIDATKQICREAPATKIIIMSMHRDSHFVLGALEAGASGYLLKDSAFEEVVLALNSTAKNDVYLSPAVAGVVLHAYLKKPPSRQRKFEGSDISGREREVLQLLAEGKSTKEIAATLFVSVKTIGTHRKQIMNKLDVHSIAGLTKYAIRERLTSLQ